MRKMFAFILAALLAAAPALAQQSITRHDGHFVNLDASGALTTPVTGITSQCLHANSAGVISGTGTDCGSASATGTVNVVKDGSTTVTGPAQLIFSGATVSNTGGDATVTINGLLEQHVASNSAELDFTTGITGACHVYELILDSIESVSNNVDLQLQFYVGGYIAGSNYGWNTMSLQMGGGAVVVHGSASAAASVLYPGLLNSPPPAFTGRIEISGMLSSTDLVLYTGDATALDQPAGAVFSTKIGGFMVSQSAPVTRLRLLMSSGNIASGTATLNCIVQ